MHHYIISRQIMHRKTKEEKKKKREKKRMETCTFIVQHRHTRSATLATSIMLLMSLFTSIRVSLRFLPEINTEQYFFLFLVLNTETEQSFSFT